MNIIKLTIKIWGVFGGTLLIFLLHLSTEIHRLVTNLYCGQ